jgi:hypothetical protein
MKTNISWCICKKEIQILPPIPDFFIDAGITVQDLLPLPVDVRDQILSHSLEIIWLMKKANIPFTDIIALTKPTRAHVLNNVLNVIMLIRAGVPFNALIMLNKSQQEQMISQCDAVLSLLRVGVSFDAIARLDESARTQILSFYFAVKRLIEAKVPFDAIVNLDKFIRTEILNRYYSVSKFVGGQVKNFNTLIAMPDLQRSQALKKMESWD